MGRGGLETGLERSGVCCCCCSFYFFFEERLLVPTPSSDRNQPATSRLLHAGRCFSGPAGSAGAPASNRTAAAAAATATATVPFGSRGPRQCRRRRRDRTTIDDDHGQRSGSPRLHPPRRRARPLPAPFLSRDKTGPGRPGVEDGARGVLPGLRCEVEGGGGAVRGPEKRPTELRVGVSLKKKLFHARFFFPRFTVPLPLILFFFFYILHLFSMRVSYKKRQKSRRKKKHERKRQFYFSLKVSSLSSSFFGDRKKSSER